MALNWEELDGLAEDRRWDIEERVGENAAPRNVIREVPPVEPRSGHRAETVRRTARHAPRTAPRRAPSLSTLFSAVRLRFTPHKP